MSDAILSLTPDASQRSRCGWQGLTVLTALVAALAAGGCAGRRPVAPLPRTAPPARPQAAKPPAPPPRPALSEQQVGPDTAPLAGPAHSAEALPDAEAALPETPPTLLAMIDTATPPNVAAATRLVEAARNDEASGNTDAALEKLERAIAIDPNNGFAYYFLAQTHFRRGTYDQAIAFADKAALLNASTQPSWASRAYGLQGEVFEAAGRFADARRAYQRAVAIDGRNRVAHEALARLGGEPTGAP